MYNAKIKNIEDKIPDITNLATNASLNAKINEVKGEIPNVTNLASTTAVTAVENKIPNVSNFVKKLTNFVQNTYFDNKLIDVISNKNELNELSKKVKEISTKGLTRDLIKFRILNESKIFFFRNISKLFSIYTS